MPGKNLNRRGPLILLAALIILSVGGAYRRPARAAKTPTAIPVLEIRQDMVYITGSTRLENPKSAKESERGQKKSRLNALDLLAFYAEARTVANNLEPADREIFLKEFCVSRSGTVSLKGVLTDRQFESGNRVYTTLKIEKNALAEISATITSLDAAIIHYLKNDIQTNTGLSFCLRRTADGTSLNLLARQQAARFYNRNDLPELALVCQPSGITPKNEKSPTLTDLQRYQLAEELIFRGMLDKNSGTADDKQTMSLVKQALNIDPHSPSAMAILSNLLAKQGLITLARLAAEKPLSNNFYRPQAANRYASCLKAEKSPVADLYKMAAENLKKVCRDDKLIGPNKNPITAMIILSLGRAFAGPASHYNSKIYQQAKHVFLKDPSAQALPLAIRAVEEDPHSTAALNLLGTIYRELGDPLKALPFFWQILKLQPDNDLAFTNLALGCVDLGLDATAAYYFDREAVKKSPNAGIQKCRQDFINRLNQNLPKGKTGS